MLDKHQRAAGPLPAARVKAAQDPLQLVQVAALATDPLSRFGVANLIESSRDAGLVLAERLSQARIVVVVASRMSRAQVDQLRVLAPLRASSARSLAILEEPGDGDLSVVAEVGISSYLWRAELDQERFVREILALHNRSDRSCTQSGRREQLNRDIDRLQNVIRTPHEADLQTLTGRELDVLRLLAEGLGLADIAARLNFSERTIKSTLYGLMNRLGLRNRPQAVAYALRAGRL